MTDTQLTWSIMALLALSFLSLPAALTYLKLREWWQMRQWRRQHMSNLIPLRKR